MPSSIRAPSTIRARIALLTGALSLLVAFGLGLFLYSSLRAQLYQSTDDSLHIRVNQLLAAVQVQNGELRFDRQDDALTNLGDEEAAHLVSPSGVVMDSLGDEFAAVSSSSDTLESRALTLRFWETDPVEGSEYETVRLLVTPILKNGNVVAYIQVGQDMETTQDALTSLLRLLLLAGPAMVGVAALGGYWLTGKALAPIEKIRQQAASIQAKELGRRLDPANSNDEVGRLTLTFNEMLARLEESFLRQRRFTADASHELRTPLAIIRGEIEVALERPRRPGEYVETLQSVGSEAERMNRLVNELLVLARSDAGELRLHLEPFDLADLLRLLIEQMQHQAREAGTILRADLPSSIPILADKDHMLELFINLITNALIHAPGSQVGIRAYGNGKQIKVRISDTGPGISPEHLPHIFDRFYRVNPVRDRSNGGNGLGLAIAQEIAQAHEGEITVESIVGKGTTFIIRLPQ